MTGASDVSATRRNRSGLRDDPPREDIRTGLGQPFAAGECCTSTVTCDKSANLANLLR